MNSSAAITTSIAIRYNDQGLGSPGKLWNADRRTHVFFAPSLQGKQVVPTAQPS